MILWKDTCHFLPKFALSFVIFFQNAHDVSVQIIKNAHFIAKIRFFADEKPDNGILLDRHVDLTKSTRGFDEIDTWISQNSHVMFAKLTRVELKLLQRSPRFTAEKSPIYYREVLELLQCQKPDQNCRQYFFASSSQRPIVALKKSAV